MLAWALCRPTQSPVEGLFRLLHDTRPSYTQGETRAGGLVPPVSPKGRVPDIVLIPSSGRHPSHISQNPGNHNRSPLLSPMPWLSVFSTWQPRESRTRSDASSQAGNLMETEQQSQLPSCPGCSIRTHPFGHPFSKRRSASHNTSSCDRLNNGSPKALQVLIPGTVNITLW